MPLQPVKTKHLIWRHFLQLSYVQSSRHWILQENLAMQHDSQVQVVPSVDLAPWLENLLQMIGNVWPVLSCKTVEKQCCRFIINIICKAPHLSAALTNTKKYHIVPIQNILLFIKLHVYLFKTTRNTLIHTGLYRHKFNY